MKKKKNTTEKTKYLASGNNRAEMLGNLNALYALVYLKKKGAAFTRATVE